uniref:Uncharacterized protein n=1 Tax=Oryza meridionalis TaxID=40149 RepID=A0A0E0FCJ6_9ORYZ
MALTEVRSGRGETPFPSGVSASNALSLSSSSRCCSRSASAVVDATQACGGESIPLACSPHAPPSILACSPILPYRLWPAAPCSPIDSRPCVILRQRSGKGAENGRKWRSHTALELSASSSRAVKAGRRTRCAHHASALVRPPSFGRLAASVLVLSASRVTQRWREESHQGVQASGVEEPPLFEAECMRVKKRKRERELLRIALEGVIVESPQAVPIFVRGADLESSEGSSDSVKKGVISFKNDPLKHIDLHHLWQTIDVTQLAAAYRPPMPSPPPPAADKGKGKRGETDSVASGSSSKKS